MIPFKKWQEAINTNIYFSMDDQLARLGAPVTGAKEAPVSESEQMRQFLSTLSKKDKKKLMK